MAGIGRVRYRSARGEQAGADLVLKGYAHKRSYGQAEAARPDRALGCRAGETSPLDRMDWSAPLPST
jgi:hypothetical protein